MRAAGQGQSADGHRAGQRVVPTPEASAPPPLVLGRTSFGRLFPEAPWEQRGRATPVREEPGSPGARATAVFQGSRDRGGPLPDPLAALGTGQA